MATNTTTQNYEELDARVFWANLHLAKGNNWQAIIEQLEAMVDEHLAPERAPELSARHGAALDRVMKLDRELGRELSAIYCDAAAEYQRQGARMGYALARTMPTTLDEFPSWPERAARLSGLPVRTD